ncbi:MAG: hypothetical protein H0W50_04955 [Parachlamydiaceae bacterium]|nr:hypothetical protein [Parachlamydiaceae bacterium]
MKEVLRPLGKVPEQIKEGFQRNGRSDQAALNQISGSSDGGRKSAVDGAIKLIQDRNWSVEGSKNDPDKLADKLEQAIGIETKEMEFEKGNSNMYKADLHKAKISEYKAALKQLDFFCEKGRSNVDGEGQIKVEKPMNNVSSSKAEPSKFATSTKEESKNLDQLRKENAIATVSSLKESIDKLDQGDKKLRFVDGKFSAEDRSVISKMTTKNVGSSEESKAAMSHLLGDLKELSKSADPEIKKEAFSILVKLNNSEWASKTIKKDEKLSGQFMEIKLGPGVFSENLDKQLLQYANSAGKEVLILEGGMLISIPKDDSRATDKNLIIAMKEISLISNQLASSSKYKISDNGADLNDTIDKLQARESTKDLINSDLEKNLGTSKNNLEKSLVAEFKKALGPAIENVNINIRLTSTLIALNTSPAVNKFINLDVEQKLVNVYSEKIVNINKYLLSDKLDEFRTGAFQSASSNILPDAKGSLLKLILGSEVISSIKEEDKNVLKESIKLITASLDKDIKVDEEKLNLAFENFTRIIKSTIP